MANNDSHGLSKVELLVRYTVCLRNHAAAAGVQSRDGCRLFVASGPNGTPATMVCAACRCHQSFHRRVEMDLPSFDSAQTENNDVFSQQAIPAPLPPQVHHHQTSRSHARPYVPGTEITDSPPQPQIHRQESTSRTPSRAPSPVIIRQEMNQPMEGGPARRSKRMTREQRDRIRAIAESNNWKMFREYSRAEVVRICSEIGITKTNLKSWINNHRRKRLESNAASN